MLQEIMTDLKSEYEDTLGKFQKDLAKIRTGRANVGMLDGVRVEYYGSTTPLNQLATLRVPEPRMITIQPWEKSVIQDIERAITSADLGLNPSNDGTMIRVPIPALTGERREELVRQARRLGEDHKIALRNQRREANDMIKSLEKSSDITEDDMHRTFEDINKLTDQYTARVDSLLEKKEADIREV
jgi:ribosome recycling factor